MGTDPNHRRYQLIAKLGDVQRGQRASSGPQPIQSVIEISAAGFDEPIAVQQQSARRRQSQRQVGASGLQAKTEEQVVAAIEYNRVAVRGENDWRKMPCIAPPKDKPTSRIRVHPPEERRREQVKIKVREEH